MKYKRPLRYHGDPDHRQPTYSMFGAHFPLWHATQADDCTPFTEWLAGYPQTTIRVRTERIVPAAYAELWMVARQMRPEVA